MKEKFHMLWAAESTESTNLKHQLNRQKAAKQQANHQMAERYK